MQDADSVSIVFVPASAAAIVPPRRVFATTRTARRLSPTPPRLKGLAVREGLEYGYALHSNGTSDETSKRDGVYMRLNSDDLQFMAVKNQLLTTPSVSQIHYLVSRLLLCVTVVRDQLNAVLRTRVGINAHAASAACSSEAHKP